MRSNYGFQKNLGFLLIAILIINYLVFLIIAFLKVFPGFLMQVILVLSFRNSPDSFRELLLSPEFYLNILTGAGVIVLLARTILALQKAFLAYRRTNKHIQQSDQIDTEEYVILKGDSLSEAFTAGLFNPRIFLSESLVDRLSQEELDAVYSHELYHKQQFDPLRSLVLVFVQSALPLFPYKRSLFDSYEVLAELAADEYAEEKAAGKKPIVSALLKMLERREHTLWISEFGFKNNRIEILVGNKFFKSKAFFSLLSFATMALILNTVLLSNTDIFMQCQHLKECFEILLHSSGTLQYSSGSICALHGDSVDHCISTSQL